MTQPAADTEGLTQALYALSAIRRDLQRCAGIEHAVVGLTTLAAVHRIGPARISDIAADLQVNLSVASRQIQALEDDGLVDRVSDPHDRRSSLVALSSAGSVKLQHAHEHLVATVERAVDGWDPADVNGLAAGLVRLRAALSPPVGEPAGAAAPTPTPVVTQAAAPIPAPAAAPSPASPVAPIPAPTPAPTPTDGVPASNPTGRRPNAATPDGTHEDLPRDARAGDEEHDR